MIKRYIYGNPRDTEAILEKPKAENGVLTEMKKKNNTFVCTLEDDTIVYGLGENVRGINKRGWIYESNCTDDPQHLETKRSLYGAHNFIILSGKIKKGFFFDTPGRVIFDIGYTKLDKLEITIANDDYEIYVLEGDSEEAIVCEFRRLIGRSYIAPKWAFGYGQSRWGYCTTEEVRQVVKEYRRNHIPLDSVYLDIDYMDHYKDFTVDEEAFPDFPAFVEEMKKEHIHLVPIIDAGVKKQDGYEVYEEGKEKNYFCKDKDGEDFIVGVWPGKCCFPDMLNAKARNWFAGKYKILLDQGIDGFWNDMNEPSIFYSEKRLEKVFKKLAEYQNKNLDVNSFFELMTLVETMSNNDEDYASFYHDINGEKVCHKDVHNLFGYYMTRAAGEAFERLKPEKRILMFSRASYIGMHRYGGIWQGDNLSWWSHLLMNIKMMPSLNMCGFLYTGADLGGFGDDVTADLLIRWLSFAIFTPLMRNHSARGTRRQEIYLFDQKDKMRDIISLRYRLLPYIYSEYMKSAIRGTMMFRPLGFVFGEDELARHVEDQLFVGDSIMIAPVYEQNAMGRNVYFPEKMKMLCFRAGEVCEECVFEEGYHYVEMKLGDVCIFIRNNRMLPLAHGGENITEVCTEEFTIYSFGDEVEAYELYEDDGETKTYSLEKNIRLINIPNS